MPYLVEIELAPALHGSVVLCRDGVSNALVAIKRVVATADAIAEARLHLRLARHRHIVPLRGTFHVDGKLHMVLDYCPNGDLYTELKRHTRLPVATALSYMAQVASAVQHMHTQGVAHRDLTLENVLLDAKWTCRVCDFGLAVALPQTCTDRVGKDQYMAPEVYSGEAYDPCKADVWSLGIMLFMLITGVPPVNLPCASDKRFGMLEAYGVHSLVNLWRMESLFSEPVMELVEMMLEVDPVQRLSMKEAASALRAELKSCSQPATTCRWEDLWHKLL